MRFALSCVYWTLLLISVVSSGLLFIIVASEGIKAADKDASANVDGGENYQAAINISDEEKNDGGNSIPSVSFSGTTQTWERRTKIGTSEDEERAADLSGGVTGAEKLGKYLPESEIFADVSTQQPNLSQGIPESGQAVVLTLVDAAAAELQSLAEPRLTLDNRGSKSIVGNLSLSASSSAGVPESSEAAAGSPATDKAFQNTKNYSVDEKSLVDEKEEEKAEASSGGDSREERLVVVVRADQSGGAKSTGEGIPPREETTRPPADGDGIDPPPVDLLPAEYDARVRLSGGGSVDEAAVALDVLVPQPGTDPHEDIPSFSEWAQKRLEEAEKKKSHPNASSQNPGGPGGRGTGSTKVRSKNYASPDCGAKIVAANPEAGSASSVLSSSRDEYMLNTCTSRVWFVVELCEAIQAEKIELANFELFSSSPRDFSVFVGDRFPSRDWSAVGQFSARDERDIQSFALDPRLFGKFVKVELHSHYGSEHFCPVSLFRVYGTSEFEVLETENQIQESLDNNDDDDDDDDEEEMLDLDDGADPPRNLFGSARDAVLSIVKKAAEVLVKSSDAAGNTTRTKEDSGQDSPGDSRAETCGTPRFSILCDDCAEPTSAEAFRLLSCQDRHLAALLGSDFINKTLSRGDVCSSLGVRAFETDATVARNYPPARFLAAIFPPGHLVALCNVFAARENRAVVNESFYVTGNSSEAAAAVEDASIAPPHGVNTGCESQSTMSATQQPVYCTSDSTTACKTPSATLDKSKNNEEFSTSPSIDDATTMTENVASLIKPTRTLERDEGSRRESPAPPILEPSRKSADESAFFDPPTTASPIQSHRATTIDEVPEHPTTRGASFESVPQTATTATDAISDSVDVSVGDADSVETATLEPESETDVERDQEGKIGGISSQDQLSLDTLLSDLKALEADAATSQNNPATPSTTLSQPQPTPQQKESVFLRLSNRIKTLERNMSLSGQYLEELSKRYKKQVEEMQRSLERAIAAMGEESRRGEEREARRVEEILDLREQVSLLSRSLGALLNDRDSWKSKFSLIGQHVILVCVEISIVLMISSYCRRSGDLEDEEDFETSEKVEPERRKSVEAPSAKKSTKKRRPSEIAVHVAGTSYRELLIDDEAATVKRGDKKRKRKRDPAVTISNSRIVRSVPKKENFAAIPGGTNLPSRRASSSDAGEYPELNYRGEDAQRRPVSAPETSDGWFSDQKTGGKLDVEDSEAAKDDRSIISEEKIVTDHRRSRGIEDFTERKAGISAESVKRTGGGILKNKRLSSPAFMKTALGSRRKRIPGGDGGFGVESSGAILRSDNWEWHSKNAENKSSQEDIIVKESATPSTLRKSKKPTTTIITTAENMNGFSSRNGRHEDSDDSGSRSTTPSSLSTKEKRSYGIKKMVKKLF